MHTICALILIWATTATATSAAAPSAPILVVGSMNVDHIFQVDRFPSSGETVTTPDPRTDKVVAGGKGANQAVAAARLSEGTGREPPQIVGNYGNDHGASMLHDVFTGFGVDDSGCGRCNDAPSGQGLVFLQPDGTIASVVVGGANALWPATLEGSDAFSADLAVRVERCACVLLQSEIPERVNEAVARLANRCGVPVMLDVGGEDRPISSEMLGLATFVAPNQSELERLDGARGGLQSEQSVVAAARRLQARGARNVLITRGSLGSLLVPELGSPAPVLRGACCPLPPDCGGAVDETGAGDCFRAAFAVALSERQSMSSALRLAAAAGAIAVSRMGATTAVASRAECEALLATWPRSDPAEETLAEEAVVAEEEEEVEEEVEVVDARGLISEVISESTEVAELLASNCSPNFKPEECPWQFASRLNSMKDRPELWSGGGGVSGWVARQGTVKGLGLVDFNYPEHLRRYNEEPGPLGRLTPVEAAEALGKAGLRCGAVCLRYPQALFRAGALTAADPEVRNQAVALTVEAGHAARALGSSELVVWSAYDGYDYALQVDHTALWSRAVESFQRVCDALPDTKVSLEFKPTDENMRFFAVPSTGAALLLCRDVDRANFGLTLDVGHCLAAGENPAQSAAMVGAAGKLFGVQMNDGYTRLGAEDGLMFGSVHPHAALELCLWLVKTGFSGHAYFDTFPRNESPVEEAEYNINAAKVFWAKAKRILASPRLAQIWRDHDGLGALDLLNNNPPKE